MVGVGYLLGLGLVLVLVLGFVLELGLGLGLGLGFVLELVVRVRAGVRVRFRAPINTNTYNTVLRHMLQVGFHGGKQPSHLLGAGAGGAGEEQPPEGVEAAVHALG